MKYVMVVQKKKIFVARTRIGSGYEIVAECYNQSLAEKIVILLNKEK